MAQLYAYSFSISDACLIGVTEVTSLLIVQCFQIIKDYGKLNASPICAGH
jgi:hypothetical protein